MGARPWFFFEDNGRKNKKKNNGRLMGALPQFSFLFQFLFSKKSYRWNNLRIYRKIQRNRGANCPWFFFSVMGTSKKKNWWAHNGRSAHEIKKIKMGASKKKNNGQRPFFGSPIFSRPWSHNPYKQLLNISKTTYKNPGKRLSWPWKWSKWTSKGQKFDPKVWF